jgi:hypothetical protein
MLTIRSGAASSAPTFLVLLVAFLLPLTALAQPDAAASLAAEETCDDSGAAASDPGDEASVADDELEVRPYEVSFEFVNLFLFRSDTDFDASKGVYEPDGQTSGVLGTFLKPDLTVNLAKNLRLFYELEIGLNLWSLHNPDQQDATSGDMFVMKHRELYAEGEFLDGLVGFKVGYQRFRDPTHLFLDHWIGAASLSSDLDVVRLTASFGQVADPTYEGFRVEKNNFAHDTLVYALSGESTFAGFVTLSTGFFGVSDSRVVGHTNHVFTPAVNLEADLDVVRLGIDGALQVGAFEGMAADGGNEKTLAWAAQLYGEAQLRRLFVKLNVLALSPDDDGASNRANGAFHGSAKNRSSTLFFTESELRDTWDNLDEKLGTTRGPFLLQRAGLFLPDVMVGYDVLPWLRPVAIVGYGMALNPDNALGSRALGLEADLGVELKYEDLLLFQVYGGVLVPGKGAAALVNAIDRTATEPLWSCVSTLKLFY